MQRGRQFGRNRLDDGPDLRLVYVAVLQELRVSKRHDAGWNRESQTLGLPPEVEKMKVLMPTSWPSAFTRGTAATARIDGGVGLDVDQRTVRDRTARTTELTGRRPWSPCCAALRGFRKRKLLALPREEWVWEWARKASRAPSILITARSNSVVIPTVRAS